MLLDNICLAFFIDKIFSNTILKLLNSALKYTINHYPRLKQLNYLKEMYVFKGFKFVINFLLYVFFNLNFKLRHVDLYYLGLIASTILMLNLKINLKYINKMSFN